jgi:hypothetical protein
VLCGSGASASDRPLKLPEAEDMLEVLVGIAAYHNQTRYIEGTDPTSLASVLSTMKQKAKPVCNRLRRQPLHTDTTCIRC